MPQKKTDDHESVLNLLVVEPHEQDRDALLQAIEQSQPHFRVTTCTSGEEAQEAVQKKKPAFDAIIATQELPGISGIDLFKKLRMEKHLHPFILLTASGSDGLASKALALGMAECLEKDSYRDYLAILPLKLLDMKTRTANHKLPLKSRPLLEESYQELEARIKERTKALSLTVKSLRAEIREKKRAEAKLTEARRRIRKLSEKALEAQEEERRMIAGELHDSLGSMLSVIKFSLESILEAQEEGAPLPAQGLEDIVFQTGSAIEEVRRISARLRPSVLDDLGLVSAISWFCKDCAKGLAGIRFEKNIQVREEEIADSHKTCCYRIFQEALTNALRHGEADLVEISLKKTSDSLELIVKDNGWGFDLIKDRAGNGIMSGNGISGMQHRAELLRGSLEIESERGKGTKIRLLLPSKEKAVLP